MNLLESHRDHPEQTDDRSIRKWDGAVSAFVSTAPRLFAIGLRVLQDVGEAEDVVQETWLRWARTDRSVVISPPARSCRSREGAWCEPGNTRTPHP
ncbi:sigma factor [Streptosporangium sp. NPDC051023]|uniref:sigma factor n=1 Tax=Streptosporangium sp. NPDC051023 TaxID=3155410 RepID=UPI00344DBEA5